MALQVSDLSVGERGRVIGFKPSDMSQRQRLLSMGVTPGAEFTVVRVAPLGDPIEIRIRDTSLTIRANEVSALLLERVSAALTIAIIGNPNCGKSTLFNGLTGSRQRVANWAGVTVEKKEGFFRFGDQTIRVVDLPGMYSLDAYDEASAIDERIARDYILSGQASLIIDLVDSSHLEHNLYLTTQLLEMKAPLVVVLNIMQEAKGLDATFELEAIQHRLTCPVLAVVASKRKDVERLKAELLRLAQRLLRPGFAIEYPPLIEEAVSDLSRIIGDGSGATRFESRWLAVRLLEGDAFATRQVSDAVKQAKVEHVGRIAQETGEEADVLIADSRYRVAHALAAEAQPARAAIGQSMSAQIDRVVLNRLLGIPIFLGVMYCLFLFTIQLARAFKPFFNQLSNAFFVEGFGQVLAQLHAPTWLTIVIAGGIGNGLLQVVNFIPIIGFLYLFISILEESGYMARASFVMDRLMRSLGLPGNVFVPMVVGFGCNVPAIMATRSLDRPRDRIIAVLMAPFMSCGGRLAVYTVFAAAFFPAEGHLVIFGMYLLGIVFAMITALLLKGSLLPQERGVQVLELPSYHLPKLRNVLISTWTRVKAFVFRVGQFIVPMVIILQLLSAWGTDGSFNKQPIDRSILAAGGRAFTPALAPIGVQEDQWPATVALLTGVLHKVVIVSTLQTLYLDAEKPRSAPPAQAYNLGEKIKRAAMTIPENLKILFGFSPPGASPLGPPKASSALAPALASHFDGMIGALAYLILLLCYPCIATTAATARETNRRWTTLMVFWTVSLGYGAAILFYQIGTFAAHPSASTVWVLIVATYFLLLGLVSAYVGRGDRREPTSKEPVKA